MKLVKILSLALMVFTLVVGKSDAAFTAKIGSLTVTDNGAGDTNANLGIIGIANQTIDGFAVSNFMASSMSPSGTDLLLSWNANFQAPEATSPIDVEVSDTGFTHSGSRFVLSLSTNRPTDGEAPTEALIDGASIVSVGPAGFAQADGSASHGATFTAAVKTTVDSLNGTAFDVDVALSTPEPTAIAVWAVLGLVFAPIGRRIRNR